MLSIIIPTFNRCRLLMLSIQKITSYQMHDFEIIIVDDASTDATQQKISKYSDQHIKYIRNKKNCGTTQSRINGLNSASGEFIIFLDDDDDGFYQGLDEFLNQIQLETVDFILGN